MKPNQHRRFFLKQTSAASLLLMVGSLPFASRSIAAESHDVVADTSYGKIRGRSIGGSYVFKGIPYGRTAKRLTPPAAPESWSGIRDAFEFGPSALQVGPNAAQMSESCQVLNLWTPGLDSDKRPVMVWLHGGGFMNGSANSDNYDGADLNRAGDVLVVTLNHRLGAFGYLYVPEAGSEHAASGSVGMLDIVAALKWVRDNIARFGGDPSNVTIFGQSGGGGKVIALLTMPGAKGLFHRAVVQSGSLLRTGVMPTEGCATAQSMLKEMGLAPNDFRSLIDAPADQVLKAQAAVLARLGTPGNGGSVAQRPFSPIIDGKELPEQPFDPKAPVYSADVPVIVGTTKEESRAFYVGTPEVYSLDPANLRRYVEPLLGADTDRVLNTYRKTRPQASATELFFAISTAQMYGYTSTRLAERKFEQRRAPVYMYQFAYEGTQTRGNPPVAIKSGHGSEIPFVFAHPRGNPPGEVPAHELALAKQMSQAWIAFARSGNPNHAGLLKWPTYDSKTRATMIFDRESAVANAPHEEERQLWAELLSG